MTLPELGDVPLCDRLTSRYDILEELGKTAGRRSLLARDRQTQALVVVKVLSFSNDFQWDDLKLFEREAETLKSLSHPAIPRYLDAFELDCPNEKGFVFVQSYIEAKPLEEHLKAGRSFNETEVKQLAKALLEILIYLQSRQPPIIHSDINLNNILLANRSGERVGDVYLVDFGSVKTLIPQEGETITVVGTYGYIPPEQYSGSAVLASDLYSLGATLIYLLTETHPADLPQKDGQIQFETEANISPAFSSWLKKLIEPSLENRFDSAQAALQILAEEPGTAITESPEICQPAQSKITLFKTDQSLDIVLSLGILQILELLWLPTLFFLGILSLSYLETLKFSVPFAFLMAFIMSLLLVTWSFFGRRRLSLKPDQLTLCYELFGIQFSLSTLNQEIRNLLYIENSLKPNRPRLCIMTESGKFELIAGEDWLTSNSLSNFTVSELEWLASELSHWLQLPITRT